MSGLFGVIATGGSARLEPTELDAVVPPSASGPEVALRSEAIALRADGWASSLRLADGLCVAGSTRLVGHPGERGGRALETVSELYRKHGLDAFQQVHGQFCLALYDQTTHQLVLATDRFATRPLYYLERPGMLAFGTSLQRLIARRDCSIDAQAILEYLFYTAIPAPRTPFVGVRKLPAGHVLVADRRGIRITPYWDMTYPESRNGSAQSWARQLREEIEAAVRRHVEGEESGERIGAFLSGGTDSSTVSGMIGQVTGRPAQTFSIGYVEEGYDELYYARTASKWFGTAQHEWKLSPAEALAALPAIVGYYEEPFGNASALPTYRCAQLAREHGVTVLFAGDGGDELFAGNARYGADKIFAFYGSVPRFVRRGVMEPLLSLVGDDVPLLGRARRYVRRANIKNPRRMFSYNPMVAEPLAELLEPEFLATVSADQMLAAAERHYDRPRPGTSELNRLLYLDLKLAIADNDVRKVSGMTELAGIDVRYPLLDTRLMELSGRIPSRLKLHRFEKRYIFKQALADFLPPEVLSKKKHGFGAPIAVWMKTDPAWRSFMGDLLHDPRTRQRGYIRPTVFDRFWAQLEDDGAAFFGDSLWPWVTLELWHREYEERKVTEGR